ncbi:hypothetical protein [Streptococcus parauberis]|uniref:hypothetical protein n=1 Tax=Streptococcus parauberis TaxID=1348 RepID=UPI0037A0A10D
MKKYIEFFDAKTRNYYSAVDELNDFIAENKNLEIRVISHQVVRYEQLNKERTYILVEVQE